jgi:hypothetical protein
VHVLQVVEFHLDPAIDVIETPEPASKGFPVQHPGRLNDKAVTAVLVHSLAIDESVERGRVDSHYRNEIVEGPNACPRPPVPPQYRENTDVEDDLGTLVHELFSGLGLAPEIDTDGKSDLSKVRGKSAKNAISWRYSYLVALEGPDVSLALPPENLPVAIEKGGGVVKLARIFLDEAGHQVGAKLAGSGGKFLVALVGEVFGKAYDIQFFPTALFQQKKGLAEVSGIIERGVGFGLYDCYSNGILHLNSCTRMRGIYVSRQVMKYKPQDSLKTGKFIIPSDTTGPPSCMGRKQIPLRDSSPQDLLIITDRNKLAGSSRKPAIPA